MADIRIHHNRRRIAILLGRQRAARCRPGKRQRRESHVRHHDLARRDRKIQPGERSFQTRRAKRNIFRHNSVDATRLKRPHGFPDKPPFHAQTGMVPKNVQKRDARRRVAHKPKQHANRSGAVARPQHIHQRMFDSGAQRGNGDAPVMISGIHPIQDLQLVGHFGNEFSDILRKTRHALNAKHRSFSRHNGPFATTFTIASTFSSPENKLFRNLLPCLTTSQNKLPKERPGRLLRRRVLCYREDIDAFRTQPGALQRCTDGRKGAPPWKYCALSTPPRFPT